MKRLSKLAHFLDRLLAVCSVLAVFGMFMSASNLSSKEDTERVRVFTRDIEFDFIEWTLYAARVKLFEASLGTESYLSVDSRKQIVLDYLVLVADIQHTEQDVGQFYSSPVIANPDLASEPLRKRLKTMQARRERIAPVAEAILQEQVSYIADFLGLTLGGQPVPPVLYHSTPLPLALIVSPREMIRQDEDISLLPDLSIQERVALEAQVDQSLNVSSLVVELGGIGTYPTMVDQSSNLVWLSEVIAHEWAHNFLTLRPLGANYLTSIELRVINETAASIAGNEIGRAVLEFYYPELVPAPLPPASTEQPIPSSDPPAFDFNKEMHLTRVTVDQLLADGKVEEAEAYMEMRRVVFWENGYRGLRKLNQAYFAFHGAYADEPGGAAGAIEDPVGEAVRALRAQSSSLSNFMNRISWVTSFEQLKQMVEQSLP